MDAVTSDLLTAAGPESSQLGPGLQPVLLPNPALTPLHSVSEAALALLQQESERLAVVAEHQVVGWVTPKVLLRWQSQGIAPAHTLLSSLLSDLEPGPPLGLVVLPEASQCLQGLSEASLRLGGSFSDVCDQAVTVLADLFNASHVTLERLRLDSLLTHAPQVVPPDPTLVSQSCRAEILSMRVDGQVHHGGELPLVGSPSEHVYQTRLPYYCQGDLRQLFPEDPLQQRAQHLRVYLGYPLFTPQGQIWGILHLMDRRPREFTSEELRLLQIFTERISTEWAQEQQQQRLEQQAQRQRLVYQIAIDIRSSLNLETVLRRAVTHLGEALQVDRCVVRLVGESRASNSGQDFFEYCRSPWPSVRHTFDDSGPLTREVIAHRRLLAIADVQADPRSVPAGQEYRESCTRSTLVVPLLSLAPESCEPSLVGIAYLNQCARVRAWSLLDRQLVQEVASQLGIAIQQALLYKQTQQRARREALVNQISSAIRSSLDSEAILEQTVQLLGGALRVDLCVIAIGSADQEAFTQVAAWKHQGRATPPSRTMTTRENSHIQSLINSQEPVAVPDLRLATHLDQTMRDRFEEWQIRASLAVATRFGGQVNGMLGLHQYHQPRAWTQEEIQVLKAVADQVAIAIHQAQLYQKIQVHNQLLERQVQERTEQLQAALAQAQQLNELKDNFLSTISHELRTPLTSMKLALQMLRVDAPLEKQQRYWQILNDQCQYEIDLVNNLLDLQRLEAGGQTPTLESIEISRELCTIANTLQSNLADRQLTLLLEVPPDLPAVLSDLCSLRRIIHELLNNACKYTPPGGEVQLQAAVESGNGAEGLRIQVINGGPGITGHDLEHIFDKFYRCSEANRQAVNGTGLGLPLVKKLLESLGGRIEVSSTPGRTCFRVWLPLTWPVACSAV